VLILPFLLCPKSVNAQLKIGRFYSPTTSDWLEIVNKTQEEINFADYLITDVSGNKLAKNVIIPTNGNCVFDYSNRLNKAGDTIFLKKGDTQIDCVKYGDAAGGVCSNSREPESDATKPDHNCFEPTPKPIQTSPPTSTPSPTEVPTQNPTPSPQILSSTTKPTPAAIAKTKPKTPKPSQPATTESGSVIEPNNYRKQMLAGGMVGLGVIFIGAAAFPFAKREYEKSKRSEAGLWREKTQNTEKNI
jgi:hypothetical protein